MLKLFIVYLILRFINKDRIGCLDIIEHQHFYLVNEKVDDKNI